MRAIVVMVVKEPVAARVKTRLCPHLSPAQAAELYALFIRDMLEELSGIVKSGAEPPTGPAWSVRLALACSPEGAEKRFEGLSPVPVLIFPQRGNDLGERLLHIFTKLCGEGYDQVHIINSDSPDMPCSLIYESIRLLETRQVDLVLGPCEDGGYYLIGSKRPIPALFQDIPWSTDRVLALTLERARTMGLSLELLEQWYDIDTYDDIKRFLDRNRSRENGCGPGWRSLRYLRDNRIGDLP